MIDSAFGHWLAGFADGEGCFQICRAGSHEKPRFNCYFVIVQRIDDIAILEHIRDVTGLGHVTELAGRGSAAPQARWQVSTKRECLALVELFDEYPLRAKKAHDFRIWREAVLAWQGIRKGRYVLNDWGMIPELYGCLKSSREFVEAA